MDEKEYSRHLSDFRGIDTTSEASQVALNRFSFIQNMYKDYKSGQGTAVETFPGTRTLANFGGKINGIYNYKSANDSKVYIVVHAGTKLHRFLHDERDTIDTHQTEIYNGLADRDSQAFIYNNRLYIIDGEHYVFVDENGVAKEATDEAYIPTTYVNGEQYEQRNMLTDKFTERYFVESIEADDSDAQFKSSDSFWEYNGERYGVICAEMSEELTSGGDSEQGEYYYVDDSSWISTACGFDCERVKIDFDKVVYYDYEEDDYSYYPTPTAHIANAPDSVSPSDFGLNIDESALVKKTPNERKLLLKKVILTDRVKVLEGTFDGCTYLSELILSNNIRSLGARFFAETKSLKTIYLPLFLESLGEDAFFDCADGVVIYASNSMYNELVSDKEKYKIPDTAVIKTYESENMKGSPTPEIYQGKNRVYIYTPCVKIDKILNGKKELAKFDSEKEQSRSVSSEISYLPVYEIVGDKEYIIAIELKCSEPAEINDYIYIHGEASPYRFTSATAEHLAEAGKQPYDEADESFAGNNPDYNGKAQEAIKNCTVCATFDDRVFFTGNPELPNTVFYTQRDLTGHNNPLYVGVLNYMNDGVGNTPNIAMMSNASTLMVLKGTTLQDGSIFYHVGADGGNDLTPRIYPSTEGLAGLGCVGMAVNFRDDCVFMSNQGLEAVAKQTVNLERTIAHRSTLIDGLMLQSDLTHAKAAEWEGYLCILIDGKMFLADSRQMFEGVNGVEYEWYYVNPVGAYLNEYKVYYWVDMLPWQVGFVSDEYKVYPLKYGDEGYVVPHYENIFSDTLDTSVGEFAVYYQVVDGVKYVVDTEGGAYQYGTYDAARTIFCVGDVLYFGTDSGCLVCLNSDKRGEDENEPDKSRIPAKWYNNSGHTYDAVAILAMENAGVPHYTKTTVKRGTVIRFKSFSRSFVEVSASTDRQSLTLLDRHYGSVTNFDDLDFANLGLLTTESNILAIKEKTKKWVEKQYMFRSDRANQPFGLYSISYRYIITGGVKNK